LQNSIAADRQLLAVGSKTASELPITTAFAESTHGSQPSATTPAEPPHMDTSSGILSSASVTTTHATTSPRFKRSSALTSRSSAQSSASTMKPLANLTSSAIQPTPASLNLSQISDLPVSGSSPTRRASQRKTSISYSEDGPRFRVIKNQKRRLSSSGTRRRNDLLSDNDEGYDPRAGPKPPVVRSAAEVAIAKEVAEAKSASRKKVRIIDAVAEESFSNARSKPQAKFSQPDIDSFMPMLKEYLAATNQTLEIAEPQNVQDVGRESDEEDYVYDVYYQHTSDKPSTSVAPSFGENGFDVGSQAGLRRMGIIAGLEDDDLFANDSHSDSSEVGDEAEEDSNDEEFYRNDYPEGDTDEDDDRFNDNDSVDLEDDFHALGISGNDSDAYDEDD